MKKKILIVGGSSGLGRELARLYAEAGDDVAVMARRGQLLTELRNAHPSIIIQQADISDDAIGSTTGQVIAQLGGLDIVIVTASIVKFNPDSKLAVENETIAINVKGFMNVLNTCWTYLAHSGGGQIVGVTSIAAARGNKIAPAYHASKSFQSIYLESLRVKARSQQNGIFVTELIPGYMRTEMGQGDRMFWVANVKKAGRQAFRAIRRKSKRAFITKRWWFVYHFQRILPIFIYDRLVNGKWKLRK